MAALFVGIAACGGMDPTNELAGRRGAQPGAPAADADGTDPGPDVDGEDAGATDPGNDGGGGPSGADGSTPVPANAFTGAAAYVAQNGPSTIKDDHGAGGNPAKRNCLDSGCHAAGGEGPRFVAGGTVYKDLAGTLPAAQVEVRVRDAAGNTALARTDANGNFYVRASGSTVTFPAATGSRDGTTTKLMAGAIADGACNSTSCHGGTQGWIHVP